MTRREEIEQVAMKFYPDCPERGFGTGDYEYPEFHDDEREAFIEGAEWADKTMMTHEEEFENFKELVKRMREAQNRTEMLTGEEHMDFVDMLFIEQREAETEVDEYLENIEV